MKNINEKFMAAGINTYGYDVTEVTRYLSDDMADRFAKASEDMTSFDNRAFIGACYDVLMQMKSVTSTGKCDLSDSAIIDKYNMLRENK